MNDLPSCVTISKTLLFIDDTKIYNTVCSPGDISLFQNDLDSATLWSTRYNMFFNPKSQTTAVANKANRILGLIKRTFNSLNTRSLPILNKSLVRLVMEYANVVWGSNYIGDCQMLEKVQRRATKCIPELFNLEYDDRPSTLNLPSLSYRRHRADMLMVYNILHGNVSLQSELFFHQQLSSITRGHSLKLFKPHAQRSV